MKQTTLRKLAREYADGVIEKEAYRSSRSEFLEGVLKGEIELSVNEYLPPLAPPTDDFLDITTDKPAKNNEEIESDITQISTPTAPSPDAPPTAVNVSETAVTPESSSSKKFIWIGAAAGLLVLIVLIVALLPESKDTPVKKEKATTASTRAPVQNVPVNVRPGKAQKLIRDFLNQKNWSDRNINSLVIQWKILSDDEKAAATGTVQLGQLTNAIYKKFLEEQALMGLGDDEAVLNKLRSLIEFAENMGIQDARLRLPNTRP